MTLPLDVPMPLSITGDATTLSLIVRAEYFFIVTPLQVTETAYVPYGNDSGTRIVIDVSLLESTSITVPPSITTGSLNLVPVMVTSFSSCSL